MILQKNTNITHENEKMLLEVTVLLNANSNENCIENEIDLKDYSATNIDLCEMSPFLEVVLPNNKHIVTKKSSYCWLLEEGKGRISTDRLKRFHVKKRKQKANEKSVVKK